MNGREKRDNSPWGVADFVWSIQKYKDPKKLRSKNQKNTKTKIKEWKGKER